jgi:hypothetical protein
MPVSAAISAVGSLGGGSAYNPFGQNAFYGGGNAFTGDAYGGDKNNPLQGLGPEDYE